MIYTLFTLISDQEIIPDITLDTLYQFEMPDPLTDNTTLKVAMQLNPDLFKEHKRNIDGMIWRKWLAPNTHGIYLVKSEFPITRDELSMMIKMWKDEGTLKEKLSESDVKVM